MKTCDGDEPSAEESDQVSPVSQLCGFLIALKKSRYRIESRYLFDIR
jgi:hypothetical protein